MSYWATTPPSNLYHPIIVAFAIAKHSPFSIILSSILYLLHAPSPSPSPISLVYLNWIFVIVFLFVCLVPSVNYAHSNILSHILLCHHLCAHNIAPPRHFLTSTLFFFFWYDTSTLLLNFYHIILKINFYQIEFVFTRIV